MSDPTRPGDSAAAGSSAGYDQQEAADVERLEQILTQLRLRNPEDILLWHAASDRSFFRRMRAALDVEWDSKSYTPSKRFDELTWWAAWLSKARSVALSGLLIVLLLMLPSLPITFYQSLLSLGKTASLSGVIRTFAFENTAPQVVATQVKTISKSNEIDLLVLGIFSLVIAVSVGLISSISNAVEAGCLFRIGGFFVGASRKNPSLLRSVIRRGALRSLIRDIFDRLYPLGDPTAEHQRRIAKQLYAENDRKIPDFDSAAENWLHWIRTVESRLLLKLLAEDPSLGYLLDDELERRKWWLRIVPIFTANRPKEESHSAGSLNPGLGNSYLLALILLIVLLPMLGGYLNSLSVTRDLHEPTVVAGPPGRDGRDGMDGKDGVAGTSGKDGILGRDGMPGKDGRDGKDGAAGRDGKDGASGRDGACCNEQSGDKERSEPRGDKESLASQNETPSEGDDVLVPFTPTTRTTTIAIDFYKSTSPPPPITLTLENTNEESWPPDPVLLIAKKMDGTTGSVSVSSRKTYNAFLNADLWIEESFSKKWYQIGSGKNLLVVHIHPHPVPIEIKSKP